MLEIIRFNIGLHHTLISLMLGKLVYDFKKIPQSTANGANIAKIPIVP